MKRNTRFAAMLAAGTSVALAVGGCAATGRPSAPGASTTTVEERGGIVRVDPTTGTWFILDTSAHHNEGLTGISCTGGTLIVSFTPLTEIITAFVDEDESYTAVYEGGASIGLSSFVITVRRGSTGAVVPCDATELRIHNSNFFVWVRGRVTE